MANTRITEKKWCDVVRTDCANPIALYWVNSIGGVDGWVFDSNRRIEDADSDHQTISKSYENLADNPILSTTLSKSRSKKYVVQAAQLTDGQYAGVLELISSPKILILTNQSTWEVDGPEFQEVKILPGSHTTQTIETLKTLTVTIELQPILTLSR